MVNQGVIKSPPSVGPALATYYVGSTRGKVRHLWRHTHTTWRKTMLMIQWLQNVPRFLASSITTYWRGRLVVFYLLSYLKPTFFSLKWHSKQKPLISRILSLSRGDLCLIHKSFLFCTTNLQGVKIQVTVFP